MPKHYILQELCENILICNNICSLSRLKNFSHSEVALFFLDKAFLYCFSTRPRVKHINFMKIIAISLAISKWIEFFKGPHLHIFCDDFIVAHGVQKTSIREKVMKLLQRIAMLCTEHDIEVQVYWIFTKQNSLPNLLFCGQYTKIANNYFFLQMIRNTFGIPLKASIWRFFLNLFLRNFFSMT